MQKGFLIALLALVSIPLIGAGNSVEAQTGVPADLVERSNPMSQVETESNKKITGVVEEALGLQGQSDFASKAEEASPSAE